MSHHRDQAPIPLPIHRLGKAVGILMHLTTGVAASCVLVSLFLISYAVVMRYFFNTAPGWVDQTVGYLLVPTVMFATADAMRKGDHISVDILTGKLSPAKRRWVEAWSAGSVMIVALILIYNGWETAMSSRMLGIVTEGNVGIPIYLLQLFLPAGGLILLVVTLEALARVIAGAPTLAKHNHLGGDSE